MDRQIGSNSDSNQIEEDFSKVTLIDFGLTQRYTDKNKEHIEDGIESCFKGSLTFASRNAHNYTKQSRRDDLISLVYLLIFLLDAKRLTWLSISRDGTKFERIKKLKIEADADQLCGTNPSESRAHFLHPFVSHVLSYTFKEAPNYSKLRFLLEKALLDCNTAPL